LARNKLHNLFFFSSLWILLQPLASTSGLSSIATTNSWKKSYRRQQKTNFNFPNSIPVTTFSTVVWRCQMWVVNRFLFVFKSSDFYWYNDCNLQEIPNYKKWNQ
jgi:hypothetical protein